MLENIKFIDLFAGIGGFRLGFEKNNFNCVFSAEINNHACSVYYENFGDNPQNDITKLDPNDIPDFDVLCAGFPCQSFSISGKQNGFNDEKRGVLFFDICKILEIKKPKVFILENVKNLDKHDNGNTLRIMLDTLQRIGYSVNYKVLNAKDFGVPQNRERVIIIGNADGLYFDFEKLVIEQAKPLEYYLDNDGDFEYLKPDEYTIIRNYKEQIKSGLIFIGYRNKSIRINGVRPQTEHLSRVHKQPNRIYSAKGMHPTLSSQETSGRYWIYHAGFVRKLTINECFRLMGFPEQYKKIGLTSKLYERIGNSVCVKLIEVISLEIKQQFFKRSSNMDVTPTQLLETIYMEAMNIDNKKDIPIELTFEQLAWVKQIVDKEETLKGVYTVLVTSLTYKILNKHQDVRYHKVELLHGYSGRSFDTKYITPFLKSKKFFGAMAESGWLTRSLEQFHPFTKDFPGKINNSKVKDAFLNILNDIEINSADPVKYLFTIFKLSIIEKSKKAIRLINPITSESSLNIDLVIRYLSDHFNYKYHSRGASILPVVAFYSIYQCLFDELSRYNDKNLEVLASHTSSDRSSKSTGDIVIRDKNNELYEVIEIKFNISPTAVMISDAFEKFKFHRIQRYYILSTKNASELELSKINEIIIQIRNEHGCQVIVNGLIPSLKYYLRLLINTDKFISRYIENIEQNEELDFEHKISWNRIFIK